jgi:hypothetical protein
VSDDHNDDNKYENVTTTTTTITTTTTTTSSSSGNETTDSDSGNPHDHDDDDGYDFELSSAPRFWELKRYRLDDMWVFGTCPQTIQIRFNEYQALYGIIPWINMTTMEQSPWWGWRMPPLREEMMTMLDVFTSSSSVATANNKIDTATTQ